MVPFETKWEKRPGRLHRVEKRYPLFPCYVFAGFESIGDFLWTRTFINQKAEDTGKRPPIVGLVGYGTRPATLTADEVSYLSAISALRPTSVNLHKAIQPGGKAQITDGPFAGQIVKVDSVSKRKAMLNLLNSLQIVEINAASLVAA